MNVSEICELTVQSISALLAQRHQPAANGKGCRRDGMRRAFPSTVELWVPDANGHEQYMLATSLNLGDRGIGVCSDVELEPGLRVGIAIHEPEATLHGQAIVRHCSPTRHGFRVGFEFVFPE